MANQAPQVGARIGVASVFLFLGPVVGAIVFILIVAVDNLFWPGGWDAWTSKSAMALVGAAFALAPSLIAGVVVASTARRWRTRRAWLLVSALTAGAVAAAQMGALAFIGLRQVMPAGQPVVVDLRMMVLAVMLVLPGLAAGVAGAVATQAWRPKPKPPSADVFN